MDDRNKETNGKTVIKNKGLKTNRKTVIKK